MADSRLAALGFSFLTEHTFGTHYVNACRLFGLKPVASGYGFLFCVDAEGRRITRATTDVSFARMIASQVGTDTLLGTDVPGDSFPVSRPGWPTDWSGPVEWTTEVGDDPAPSSLAF